MVCDECTTFLNRTNQLTDPTNCRVYYYCKAGASIPERYECPNGFIYNTWIQSCELEPENVTDVCAGRRFDCDKPVNVEKVIPYQFHPTYYAYCTFTAANVTGVYVEIWMLKCIYEELQEFVVTDPPMCRFACRQKGFFQNPERCQEYVYCSGEKAVPTVMQCATNYVYDGTRCTTDKTKCLYP